MMKSINCTTFIFAIVFLIIFVGISSADIIVDESQFAIELVASYSSVGMGEVTDIALDSDGVIYVDHRGDSGVSYRNGSITRIDSTGVSTRWIDNVSNARTIIWTGGTAFGENLYFSEAGSRKIHKLNGNGNVSVFLDIVNFPRSIDVDRNGSLGGDMFGAPRGTDKIQRIKPDGSVSTFSSWPGVVSGGGVEDLAISPTSKFDGDIFVAFDVDPSVAGNPEDGIYKIDNVGNASRFATSIHYARALEFDTSGLMFDNDLFAIGMMSGVAGMHLWRIDELGNAEDFIPVGWGVIDHIAFGPDGAMYVSEYFGDTTNIIRISEVPEPASLLMLGLGGFLIRRKRKLS